MKKEPEGSSVEGKAGPEFKEGIDYYFEQGFMVLTAEYLRKRGRCCGSGCRNCPYPKQKQD